jgi:hypothetical protein
MPSVRLQHPRDNEPISAGVPFAVAGVALGSGGLEQHGIETVIVVVDAGAPLTATIKAVPKQPVPTVTFSLTLTLTDPGPHLVAVTALDDGGGKASAQAVVQVPPPVVTFPAWHATGRQIIEDLYEIADYPSKCTSMYLDTLEQHSNDDHWPPWGSEGLDHHQGIARTHRLSDGSVFFFLAHSEMDFGDKGNLMQFRYAGPVDGEHVQATEPPVVAPLVELRETTSQHPCDMAFLPEINGVDAGYLFVAEQTPIWAGGGTSLQIVGTAGWLGVYRWSAGEAFQPWGTFGPDQLSGPPNFVFLDRFADTFVLGVVPMYDGVVGHVDVFTADAHELFPQPVPGYMNLSAFRPASGDQPDFPVDNRACQVHTVTDVTGQHYLLAFRGEPPDTEDAEDYVDLHTITFPPLAVTPRIIEPVHITFAPGDTSFASTGTAYVEASGRLLLASSYRWAEDEGPGDSNYVSRVDECPSLSVDTSSP